MTTVKSPDETAIDNARALMDGLLKSDWKELHVASDGLEVFIARDGAGPNPMLGEVIAAAPVGAVPPVASAVAKEITAPHVATLVSLVAEGTEVQAGDSVAVLSVLDEEEDLPAPAAGRVTGLLAKAGDLVEFGTPLLQIEERG